MLRILGAQGDLYLHAAEQSRKHFRSIRVGIGMKYVFLYSGPNAVGNDLCGEKFQV